MIFKGKNVLIFGSGTSGRSAANVLEREGAEVTVIDSKTLPQDVDEYNLFVVSPGIKHTHPVYKYALLHDVPIMGEIGLGAMLNTRPVIAVTGTNGKTTTVEMLGRIYEAASIKAAVCGNIGSSFAEKAEIGGYDRVVLELSSFQLLQSSPLKVHIAVITNIAEDHLDYHGNMLEYRHAKLRIADRQTSDDYLIVPPDLNIIGMRGKPTVKIAGRDCSVINRKIYLNGEFLMHVDEMKVKGAHNVQNALNAAYAAYLDGVELEYIRIGLSAYEVSAHRIAAVCEYNGTAFYNDSKGTNISATLAAVDCMNGKTALIVGGSDKGYDYDTLFDRLKDKVAAVFVTGGNADRLLAAAKRTGYENIIECAELGDAVRRAAVGGYDSVLFSPASASFDRYKNYAERGEAFESEVRKLFAD